MTNYSQWHSKRALTSKKVNYVEQIASLSEKVDTFIYMIACKNDHVDPNDVPLSTLIDKKYNAMDVNFISQKNFNNNAYRGNFNTRLYPGNSSNN